MAQLFALENSHSLKNLEPISETLASFDETSLLPLRICKERRGRPNDLVVLSFVFVCERLGDETFGSVVYLCPLFLLVPACTR